MNISLFTNFITRATQSRRKVFSSAIVAHGELIIIGSWTRVRDVYALTSRVMPINTKSIETLFTLPQKNLKKIISKRNSIATLREYLSRGEAHSCFNGFNQWWMIHCLHGDISLWRQAGRCAYIYIQSIVFDKKKFIINFPCLVSSCRAVKGVESENGEKCIECRTLRCIWKIMRKCLHTFYSARAGLSIRPKMTEVGLRKSFELWSTHTHYRRRIVFEFYECLLTSKVPDNNTRGHVVCVAVRFRFDEIVLFFFDYSELNRIVSLHDLSRVLINVNVSWNISVRKNEGQNRTRIFRLNLHLKRFN